MAGLSISQQITEEAQFLQSASPVVGHNPTVPLLLRYNEYYDSYKGYEVAFFVCNDDIEQEHCDKLHDALVDVNRIETLID